MNARQDNPSNDVKARYFATRKGAWVMPRRACCPSPGESPGHTVCSFATYSSSILAFKPANGLWVAAWVLLAEVLP